VATMTIIDAPSLDPDALGVLGNVQIGYFHD
jgi:hypothetical protein